MEKTCSFCGNADLVHREVEYIYRHNGEYLIVTGVPCEECAYCGERYFDALTLRKIESDFENISQGRKTPAAAISIPVERYAQI